MKPNRLQKSEYLFREIGNIPDHWVAEALSYRPKRSPMPRVLLIAASVALSAALLMATLLIGMHRFSKGNEANNAGVKDQAGGSVLSLDDLLINCRSHQNASFTVLSSPAEVDFFSSEVHVAWQYADSSAVYVSRALTHSETQRLEKSLDGGTNTTDTTKQPACMIWILYGDGRVVSPYLHPSIGNTGEGELFDYHVEIIPNADFSSCLSEILN